MMTTETLIDSTNELYADDFDGALFEEDYKYALRAVAKRAQLRGKVLGYLAVNERDNRYFGTKYGFRLILGADLQDAINELVEDCEADDLEINVNEQRELEIVLGDHDGSSFINLYPLSASRFDERRLSDFYYYGAEYSDLFRLYHQIRRKHGVTLARVR